MISRIAALMFFSMLATGLAGCQDASRQPMTTTAPGADRPPVFCDDIIHVSLMVDLPLLDEDGDGLPEGAQIKVMLNRPGQSDYVAGRGSLIVHLIKRERDDYGKFNDTELYTWQVDQERFTQSVVRQRFGLVCHQMSLYWVNVIPQGNGISLRAEFVRVDNKHLWSHPVTLSVPPASTR